MRGLIIGSGPSFDKYIDELEPAFFTQFDHILTIHNHRKLDEKGVPHKVFGTDFSPVENKWLEEGNHYYRAAVPYSLENEENAHLRSEDEFVFPEGMTKVCISPVSFFYSGTTAMDWLLQSGCTTIATLGLDYGEEYSRDDQFERVVQIVAQFCKSYRFQFQVVGTCHPRWQSVVDFVKNANKEMLVCAFEFSTGLYAVLDEQNHTQRSDEVDPEHPVARRLKRTKDVWSAKALTKDANQLGEKDCVEAEKIICRYKVAFEPFGYEKFEVFRPESGGLKNPFIPYTADQMTPDLLNHLKTILIQEVVMDHLEMVMNDRGARNIFMPSVIVVVLDPHNVTEKMICHYVAAFNENLGAVGVTDPEHKLLVVHCSYFIGNANLNDCVWDFPNILTLRTPHQILDNEQERFYQKKQQNEKQKKTEEAEDMNKINFY